MQEKSEGIPDVWLCMFGEEMKWMLMTALGMAESQINLFRHMHIRYVTKEDGIECAA